MMNHRSGRRLGALAVLFVSLCAPAALAADEAALRAERDSTATQMIADPANRTLMLRHARLSIKLREFEPAVSSLERYLDIYPQDYGARLDLAISYFALGAYTVADTHFAALLAANPDESVARTIRQYQGEIANRTATHGFEGSIAVGAAYSTNASLASDSDTVFSFGTPFVRAAGNGPKGDVGATVSARLKHRYDLGTAYGDYLFTEGGAEMLHFLDKSNGDFDGFFLRTGPVLSITEEAYGPKLRPFVEADTVVVSSDWLYTTVSGGLQYNHTLTADWSVHATARSGYRWRSGSGANGAIQQGTIGGTYWASRDLRVRLSGFGQWDISKADAIGNFELGARLGLTYDFDPSLGIADRKWRIDSYAQVLSRQFTDADATVDPTRKRDDVDFRVGTKLTAHLVDGFYTTAGLDWLTRDSNIAQFDGDEVLFSAAVGYDF